MEHGGDAGRGNLLGIQPWLTTADYASEEALAARLDGYLQAAAARGWLSERSIVVLPEYIGTWLAAAGEGRRVQQASNLTGAMTRLALRHPLAVAAQALRSGERDKLAAGLFRARAEYMASAYQAVFSRLASRRRVTIAAGSIVLPRPEVAGGVVCAGQGPLQSVCAVFGPDGRAHGALVRKVVPTRQEQPMFAGAAFGGLPAFDTPAGRMGVLICADAWYPPAYAALRQHGVALVVVPSAILPGGLWDQPWQGYSGAPPPDDVDLADVGVLTEGQAWRKYALAGRIGLAGCQTGLNVFLRGRLWNTSTDGCSVGIAEGRVVVEASVDGAALVNVWL